MIVSAVTNFFSFSTLLADLGLVLFIGLILLQRLSGKSYAVWHLLKNVAKKYGLVFAFIIATAATIGSLFYSEIAGYNPCKLCWIQRIFIYPLVVLLWIALIKQFKKEIIYYSIALSLIGMPISAYHYYLQRWGGSATPCSTVGYSESCAQNFFLNFGYITLPMMAMTAFLLIIASLWLYQLKPQDKRSLLRRIFRK